MWKPTNRQMSCGVWSNNNLQMISIDFLLFLLISIVTMFCDRPTCWTRQAADVVDFRKTVVLQSILALICRWLHSFARSRQRTGCIHLYAQTVWRGCQWQPDCGCEYDCRQPRQDCRWRGRSVHLRGVYSRVCVYICVYVCTSMIVLVPVGFGVLLDAYLVVFGVGRLLHATYWSQRNSSPDHSTWIA